MKPIIITIIISTLLMVSAISAETQINPKYSFDINDPQARLEYQNSIPINDWPENIPGGPMLYDEWRALVGETAPFKMTKIGEVASPSKDTASVGMLIVINETLYPSISGSIDIYINDLLAEGYDVKTYLITGGTPEAFKAELFNEYGNGMRHCLLIGDMPVAWFEATCWESYTNFPLDLYYMDMDGIWEDSDDDGMFDSHTGDMGPEITLGRLTAGTLDIGSQSEAELVNKYFAKNHAYRTGTHFLNNRGLSYIDDDWSYWDTEWSGNLGMAYSTFDHYAEDSLTTAEDYEVKWLENYESILVCVHSWPQGHSFKVGANWTSTHNYDIVNQKPKAHFYNLFACSNSRYTSPDYCGGWYIFYDDYGLASLGSTKTGSMLHFGYFYGPLGQGRTMGEAFLDWFEVMASWGFPINDLCWFYGMTLCGDPTIKHIDQPPVVITTESLPYGAPTVYYCDTIHASGGLSDLNYSVASGVLPVGLVLDSVTGEIAGTPVEVGNHLLTFLVKDNMIPPNQSALEVSLNVLFLCGDVDHTNTTNILDILNLIQYLYQGGSTPDPYVIGDVDGSGVINIIDITYYIAFLYQGGENLNCP